MSVIMTMNYDGDGDDEDDDDEYEDGDYGNGKNVGNSLPDIVEQFCRKRIILARNASQP